MTKIPNKEKLAMYLADDIRNTELKDPGDYDYLTELLVGWMTDYEKANESSEENTEEIPNFDV